MSALKKTKRKSGEKENRAALLSDLGSAALGSLMGMTALCMLCLLFAVLLFFRILPIGLLSVYAALSGLIAGFSAMTLIGSKGRILFFLPLSLGFLLFFLWITGKIIGGGLFIPLRTPWIPAALVAGMIAGGLFANRR